LRGRIKDAWLLLALSRESGPAGKRAGTAPVTRLRRSTPIEVYYENLKELTALKAAAATKARLSLIVVRYQPQGPRHADSGHHERLIGAFDRQQLNGRPSAE
jgi:hypothetical protein